MGEFWKDQTGWPRDTPKMIFLGRAVNQLGRAIFGEDWTGEEPGIRTFSYFKIVTRSRETNNFIACHLPQFGRKEYNSSMAPPPTGHDDFRRKFEFSKEELQEMKLFIDRHNATVPSAKERFIKVQTTITDGAGAGKLGTSFRALAGGDVYPVPSHWWNTERLEQRFASCRIDPEAPFGPGGAAWIFVSRSDLENLLQASGSSQTPEPRRRRGPPQKYDWEDGKLFVFRELDAYGDFDLPKNHLAHWRSQNDLIDRLLRYMGRQGKEPGHSTAQGYVSEWVIEWRAAANNSPS
jgi:hypothetical protein